MGDWGRERMEIGETVGMRWEAQVSGWLQALAESESWGQVLVQCDSQLNT